MRVKNYTKRQMRKIIKRWFRRVETKVRSGKYDRYSDFDLDNTIEALEKVERWRRMFRVHRDIVGDLAFYYLSDYRESIDDLVGPHSVGGDMMRKLMDVSTLRRHREMRMFRRDDRLDGGHG